MSVRHSCDIRNEFARVHRIVFRGFWIRDGDKRFGFDFFEDLISKMECKVRSTNFVFSEIDLKTNLYCSFD